MGAGIEKHDHMAYVGAVPWHGLGTELPNIATAREMLVAAKLDWKVSQLPVRMAGIDSYNNDDVFPVIPGYHVNVRMDTGDPLGIVGQRYQVLQNGDAFSLLDKITRYPGGPKYVTAGSLFDGKKVWALAKLPDCIKVTRDDVIEQYLLISNTHDGSSAVSVMWTPVRVVCNNTLSMALSGYRRELKHGRAISIKHVGNVRSKVGNAREVLGIVQHNMGELEQIVGELRKRDVTTEQVDKVCEKLIGGEATSAVNGRDTIKRLFESGIGNTESDVSGTGWALYNGCTEYADHWRTVRAHGGKDAAEARLNSVWYGSAAEFKQNALDTILSATG